MATRKPDITSKIIDVLVIVILLMIIGWGVWKFVNWLPTQNKIVEMQNRSDSDATRTRLKQPKHSPGSGRTGGAMPSPLVERCNKKDCEYCNNHGCYGPVVHGTLKQSPPTDYLKDLKEINSQLEDVRSQLKKMEDKLMACQAKATPSPKKKSKVVRVVEKQHTPLIIVAPTPQPTPEVVAPPPPPPEPIVVYRTLPPDCIHDKPYLYCVSKNESQWEERCLSTTTKETVDTKVYSKKNGY